MSVDIEAIKQIVLAAGELSLIYYGRVSASVKADLSIVTEADAAIENYLKLALTGLAPGYGYLGEETEETRPPRPIPGWSTRSTAVVPSRPACHYGRRRFVSCAAISRWPVRRSTL
jgi:3'-phosphoadenosine 5'-phosphosulfate (PAPS) 3'-phosphatase